MGSNNQNIFRQAKILLNTKRLSKMTDEERQVVNTALIPLMVNTDGFFPEDITIGEGLEMLAQLVEREGSFENREKAGWKGGR